MSREYTTDDSEVDRYPGEFDYYLPPDHDWVPEKDHTMREYNQYRSRAYPHCFPEVKPAIAFHHPFPTLTYVNGHLVRVKDETRYSPGNHDGEG